MRIIALGQGLAGDDGVGLAVIQALRRGGIPRAVELLPIGDPSRLFSHLETAEPVVLVDAALGDPPGRVVEAGLDDLLEVGCRPLSSHGFGLRETLALLRSLAPERIAPSIRLVLICIDRPARPAIGLSPPVAAAVEVAADRIRELVLQASSPT